MATVIKGHRIANESIGKNHLKAEVRFNETEIDLNFPTHSNKGDLTEADKNTLTQKGNADELHYHNGGGGGPAGIYTNEERDAQLLRLNLMINSTQHGIDKSVRNHLSNGEEIDYGLIPAITPTVLLHEGLGDISGVLPPNKIFSYAVTYLNKYGETNINSNISIVTSSNLNNAVEISIPTIKNENLGYAIYRAEGRAVTTIAELDNPKNVINNDNINNLIDTNDKTSGIGALSLRFKGPRKESEYNSPLDLLQEKMVLDKNSEAINSIISKSKCEFIIYNMNQERKVKRLNIIWGPELNLIPTDYEIFYTENDNAMEGTEIEWLPLDFMTYIRDMYGNRTNMSTDGNIEAHKILGNSRAHNCVYLEREINLSAIKIVVTRKITESFRLKQIGAFTEGRGSFKAVNYKLDTPLDLEEFNSIMFDMKTNGSKNNLKLDLLCTKDTDVTDESVLINNNNHNNYYFDYKNCYLRGYVVSTSNNALFGFDKIKIAIACEPGQYTEFENVFIHLNDENEDINSRSFKNQECIPVTFNGEGCFKGIPSNPSGRVESDWIDICCGTSKNNKKGNLVIGYSLYLRTGRINMYNSGAGKSWWSHDGLGYEDIGYIENIPNKKDYNHSAINWISRSKSSSPKIEINSSIGTSDELSHKWNKNINPINVPLGKRGNYDTLRITYCGETSKDEIFLIDNIKATSIREISGTVVGSEGLINPSYIEQEDSNVATTTAIPAILAPQFVGYEYLNEVATDNVYLGFQNITNMAKDYAIQYTTNAEADIEAPYNDRDWTNVSNLKIGIDERQELFTGNAVNGRVYNNNVYGCQLQHVFDKVNIRKIRIVVFATNSPTSVLGIYRFRVNTPVDKGIFKLIQKENNSVNSINFVDTGIPETDIIAEDINTTGSFGVRYDSFKKAVVLLEGSTTGTVYFKDVEVSMYQKLLLSAQIIGDVSFEVSNDNGKTFESIELEKTKTFLKQSQFITLKATITGKESMLSAYGFLYTL